MNSTQSPTLRDALEELANAADSFAHDVNSGAIDVHINAARAALAAADAPIILDADHPEAARWYGMGYLDGTEQAGRPAPIGAVAPDESRALYTPDSWQVRDWALEEAACLIEKGCGYNWQQIATAIRALSAAPAAPIAEVTEGLFCTCVTCGLCKALNTHAAPDYAPKFDEAEFDAMVERGTKAWKDVPDDWLEQERGNEPVDPLQAELDGMSANIERQMASLDDLSGKDIDPETLALANQAVVAIEARKPTPGAAMLDAIERKGAVKATPGNLIPVSNVSSFVSFANERGLSGESWNLALAAFERGQQAGAVDGAPSTNSAAGWISVDERLPEDGVYVWAHWCGAGDWNADPRMGEARRACGGWQPAGSVGFDWNVTHWQPLPAAPTMQQSTTP